MITEKRHEIILDLLNKKGIVTAIELMTTLNASESTIRRDLTYLEEQNLLKRVHGGAKSITSLSTEFTYKEKLSRNKDEKTAIAKFAANLIQDGDCVFLDAGTTTYEIIKYLDEKEVTVVTNGLNHINLLASKNINCFILGGNIKLTTKAVVGIEAIRFLEKFRFDKCFMGANGVDVSHGFTTPDNSEAAIKEVAIKLSKKTYIVCDHSKLNEVSFIKFGDLKDGEIITSSLATDIENFKDITTIKVVDI